MDKKIKTLMEALPRLDETEARRLLERAGGSINKASDMALEDGEWSAAPAKKKPVKKDEKKDKETTVAPRRTEKVDRPRREFVKVEPKAEKKAEIKATPSTIVVGGSKAKVEAGLSFADMIKRQKQSEPVVEAVVEPTPVAAPAAEEEVPVVVTPVAAEETVVEVAPVVVEAAPKPKKERKEPKKKAPAPLPQKYIPEIDRLPPVTLPDDVAHLATNAFTFSSEPGRAPSPPRQVQPVHQPIHHQPDWNNNVRQHQPTAQRSWNQESGYNNARNQHFTNDWRQNNRGYNNDGMGYNTQRMNYRQDNSGYHQNAMRTQPQAPTQSFW